MGSNEDHCQRSYTDCLLAKKNSALRGVFKSEFYGKRENFLSPRVAGPSCLVGHRVHASKRDVIRLLEDSVEQSAFLYDLDPPKEIASDLDLLAEIAEPSNKHSAVAAVSLQKRIAGAFIKRTNFKLLAEGVAHALDLAITSNIGTAQNWASQSWISKAAVSKVTKFWQWELGLLAGIAHAQSRKMSGLQRGSKNGDTKNSMPPRWRGRRGDK